MCAISGALSGALSSAQPGATGWVPVENTSQPTSSMTAVGGANSLLEK